MTATRAPVGAVDSILAAAREALCGGRPEQAQDLYEQQLAQNPDDAEVLSLLGTVLLQRGASLRATQVLQRAVAVQPRHLPALTQLGRAFADAGHFEGAEDALRRAIQIEPRGLCHAPAPGPAA